MIPFTFDKIVFRWLSLLLLLMRVSVATSSVYLRQGLIGIGIYIDHRDRFILATSCDSKESMVIAQGFLDLNDPLRAELKLRDSTQPIAKEGIFLKTITTDPSIATQLSVTVFEQLKSLIDDTKVIAGCTIAVPVLSSTQREAISSLAKAVFRCEDATTGTDALIAIQALDIQLEEQILLVIVPSCITYVIAEDDVVPFVLLDTIRPPFDPHRAFKHGTPQAIIYIHDDAIEDCLNSTTQINGIPVRREHASIIARGGAIQSSYSIPVEPPTLLPLSLNVVLYGSHSHALIKRFDILPKHANVTLTTVHDNQDSVTIELVEGQRPRADDNIPFTQFVLSKLPPAPAGVLQIRLSVAVDRYLRKVELEAAELKSGSRAEHVVERGVLPYPEGILQAHERAEEEHLEEDQALENTFSWIAEGRKYSTAVQLFEENMGNRGHRGHEEL